MISYENITSIFLMGKNDSNMHALQIYLYCVWILLLPDTIMSIKTITKQENATCLCYVSLFTMSLHKKQCAYCNRICIETRQYNASQIETHVMLPSNCISLLIKILFFVNIDTHGYIANYYQSNNQNVIVLFITNKMS